MPAKSKSNITFGPASWIGLIVSVLSLLPPLVTQLIALVENVSVHWTSGEKLALIVGAVTAAVTLVGRFAQAVAERLKGG